MKLILNIREKTLIEDDTDPLGEPESLQTLGSHTARSCFGVAIMDQGPVTC